MAVTTFLQRKISFPAKFTPWNLSTLRKLDQPLSSLMKHHLRFMPSTSPAALYMPIDAGGMGLSCLSTQVTLDKLAALYRGLPSHPHTVRAITGLLDHSLRIDHSESDEGYEATIAVRNVPHLPLSLLEYAHESGLAFGKGGLPASNTPSLLLGLLPTLKTAVRNKLMHFRITTHADLMVFSPTGTGWDTELCTYFPCLYTLLPT